jgi:hypothetical protein
VTPTTRNAWRTSVALVKLKVANDHSQRLHDRSQLAPVAGNVFDDAPLDLGIA